MLSTGSLRGYTRSAADENDIRLGLVERQDLSGLITVLVDAEGDACDCSKRQDDFTSLE